MNNDFYDDVRVEVGNRIRDLRLARGYTQRVMMDKLNYKNNASVAMIESGASNVSIPQLYKIAHALHTNIFYLLGYTDVDDIRGFESVAVVNNPMLANSTAWEDNIDKKIMVGNIFTADFVYRVLDDYSDRLSVGSYAVVDTVKAPNDGDLVAVNVNNIITARLIVKTGESLFVKDLGSPNALVPFDDDAVCYYGVIIGSYNLID